MSILASAVALSYHLQSYTTVPDFASFLMMRQYAGNGAIQVGRLYVAFPKQDGKYKIVTREGDKVLGSVDMVLSQEPQQIIGLLEPVPGSNGVVGIGKDGAYTVTLQEGEDMLATLKFSIKGIRTGDEFTGKTVHTFDGPWKHSVAFVKNPNRDDISFRLWTSTSEIGSTKQTKVEVAIMKGTSVIGKSKPQFSSSFEWQPFEFKFDKADGRTAFTPADFATLDGEYAATVTIDGKVSRTHKFAMKKGVMTTDPKSAMDYSPRSDHMLPKTVTSTTNENLGRELRDVLWIPPAK
jgi:hypothetical protein